MTVRTRFAWWIVCVVGLLTAAPLGCVMVRSGPTARALFLACFALNAACYVGLVALLCTTPPDAIRLPPRRSVRLITVATAVLYFACWFALRGVGPAFAIAGLMTAVTFALVRRLVVEGVSPWLTTPLVWLPGFVGPLADLPAAAVFAVWTGLTLVVIRPSRPN